MKKLLAIAVALIAFAAVANAQPKAFGVRMGMADGASYQHWLGNNFLEVDAMFWINSGFTASAIYYFSVPLSSQVAVYSCPGVNGVLLNNVGFNFGVCGQLGIEWEIPSVPLNVSVDWMPVYWFGVKSFVYTGAGLGIRYRF